jgi:hypothetical protein
MRSLAFERPRDVGMEYMAWPGVYIDCLGSDCCSIAMCAAFIVPNTVGDQVVGQIRKSVKGLAERVFDRFM